MSFGFLLRGQVARVRSPLAFPSSFPSTFPSLALAALLLVGLAAAAWAVNPTTVLVTRGIDGGAVGTTASARTPAISADGRWVAFVSNARNFPSVEPGSNNASNLFAKNLATGALEWVSVGVGGVQPNGGSFDPSLSADGRYVAFAAGASNLVAGDTNGTYDIFVRDLSTSVTARVNVGPDGVQANLQSRAPSISADGRYVAFTSSATNLVPGDTNGMDDIFVRDLVTGATTRASLSVGGAQASDSSENASISPDGRYVVFASAASNLVAGDTNNNLDIFVRDRSSGITRRASVGLGGESPNGYSYGASISADGRYVAFLSDANNLVADDSYHRGDWDVFVRDLSTGSTVRVIEGGYSYYFFGAPSLSADGRYVAFESYLRTGSGSLNIYVWERSTGNTRLVSVGLNGGRANRDCFNPSVSAGGRYVTFASQASDLVVGDRGGSDIFVRDLSTDTTTRASVRPDGEEGSLVAGSIYGAAISADGRSVAFDSDGTNLVASDTNETRDTFVRNLATGVVIQASAGAGGSSKKTTPHTPSQSADGRYVAFESDASDLVPDDTNNRADIFVRDLSTGVTTRASVGPGGIQANQDCFDPSISADGRYVAFESIASTLVAGDTNGITDIFVRDLVTGVTIRATIGLNGAQPNSDGFDPSISADGRYVAFQSWASNLAPGDTNGQYDIYVRDLATGTTVRASLGAGGAQANGLCSGASLSADGRYVAFQSNATNLVSGDTNGQFDIFVRDLLRGSTTRASLGADGAQANRESFRPSLSAEGRYVAFDSPATNLVSGDRNNQRDVFVRDLAAGSTTRASVGTGGVEANGPSSSASISVNGRVISYISTASNLTDEITYGTTNVFATTLPSAPPAPSAPSHLTAVAITSRRVNLAWTDHTTDETGFEIWASLNEAPFSRLATTAANQTSYQHLGPEGNYTLHYQVRALTASYPTDFSNLATGLLMAQPLGLTAKALNSTTLDVRWKDNATNEGSYEVWRAVGGGVFTLLATKFANATQHTDTVPAGNQTYTYKVCCRSGAHLSSFSNQKPAVAMLAPTNLAANAVSSTQVDLTWTDNSAALETGFQVYRRTTATGGQTLVGTTAANATSFSDPTVLPGKSYWYEVRAANGPDLSNFSNLRAVTTP